MRLLLLFLALALAALPSAAYADVVWPAVVLTERLLAWWVIALSLFIEFLFVRMAFRLGAREAAWATIAANALSAGIGIFALPFLGLLAEASISDSGLADLIGYDAFGLAAWILAYLIAVILNVAIEVPVYRFGYRLPLDSRAFWLIALANAITVAIAFASLAFVPSDN